MTSDVYTGAAGEETTGKGRVLSARELQVLALIGEGKSSKEAAQLLFVSPRTIDFHLASCYRKLGVCSRIQAINEATRWGLLS